MRRDYARTRTVAIVMFASLVVCLVFGLIISGHGDYIDKFSGLLMMIIPVTIGVVYTSRQNDSIKDDVTSIKTNVNGKLDKQLSDIMSMLYAHATAIEELTAKVDGGQSDNATI